MEGLDKILGVCYYGNDMSRIRINNQDFITVPEAAKIISKPKMTLYRWIKADKVISVSFGDILFIPKSEVSRLSKKERELAEAK